MLLTVAGTAVPGLGLILAGRRVLGGAVLGLFASLVLTLSLWALTDPQSLASMAVRPTVLRGLTVGFAVLAVLWVLVVVATHLCLRDQPSRGQRVLGGLLVGTLAFAVAAPMAVAARYSYDQANLVSRVFKRERDTRSATRPTLQPAPSAPAQPGDPQPQDPWADKPRLNLLLLGGDAGRGRVGTRTDTAIVASIDTATGDTTMFSLPRNTARLPFPSRSPLRRYYPYGFTDGNGQNPEFFLNAMYQNLPNTVPADVLGPTDNLGADALKLSTGAALGLKIDYFVLVNLRGFERLVDALGGIRVNVNGYIPIGGNTDLGIPPKDYIAPGPDKLLNGRDALWYARGRYGSDDFARMDRQRCVIKAIIDQANPANLLARYEDIAKAGQEIVITDMPQEVLPMMVELSLRVKDGNVRSIVFKNGVAGFWSAYPDFDVMRQRVKVALGEAKAPTPTTKPPKKPAKRSPSASSTPESEDLADSCAYDPKAAASAERPR